MHPLTMEEEKEKRPGALAAGPSRKDPRLCRLAGILNPQGSSGRSRSRFGFTCNEAIAPTRKFPQPMPMHWNRNIGQSRTPQGNLICPGKRTSVRLRRSNRNEDG